MNLANTIFLYDLKKSDSQEEERLRRSILEVVENDQMSYLYSSLCEKYGWSLDEALLADMKWVMLLLYRFIVENVISISFINFNRSKNEAEVVSLEAKIEDAKKNAGDTEVHTLSA